MSTGLAIALGIFALWVLAWGLVGAAARGDRQLRGGDAEARDELARIRRRREREDRRRAS